MRVTSVPKIRSEMERELYLRVIDLEAWVRELEKRPKVARAAAKTAAERKALSEEKKRTRRPRCPGCAL
jgi:hypothetical protein